MRKQRTKTSTKANSLTIRLCISIIASVAISMVLTCLITGAIENKALGDSVVKSAIFGIRMVSVFTGCLIGLKSSKNRLVVAGIVVGTYILVLLFLGVFFYNGTFQNFGAGIISCLIGALGALLIGMIHTKKKINTRYFNK